MIRLYNVLKNDYPFCEICFLKNSKKSIDINR